jgi:serine phosphatase RsbU (regulator of sigma subunit)/anti-sigma regulatory factor (Ser/Thr protein kinase)
MDEAITEVTATLNQAQTAQEIVDTVGTVVRAFAGWYGVAMGLTDPDEPVLHQYWSAPLNDSVRARYLRVPLDVETPQSRSVRTATPVFVPDAATLQAMFPGPFRDAQTEGLGACAALPLVTPDRRTLGSLALMWMDELQFTVDDMEFAERLAAVTSHAVARVQAVERERSLAVALQTALLTLDVRSLDVVVGARYLSADSALKIGGDWYDAIEREDGKVCIAVGDVVGNGLHAATTMGRLRSSLGITALQTTDPARALRYLDDYARHVPGATAATVCIAVHDPARQRLSYVSAGHPPAFLVTPTGRVHLLNGGRSWPLVVTSERERPLPATATFTAGSLLLLYTDGVVERRGEVIDRGIERLAAALRNNWNLPVRPLLGAMLDDLGLERGAPHDDIALIALRSVGSSATHFADALRATSPAIADARGRFRRWLQQTDVDPERIEGMVLSVHEVLANAVEHGSGNDRGKTVHVEACVRSDELVVSVQDSGTWQSGIEWDKPERGRGFRLINHFADSAEIDTGPMGTAVTLTWQ